LMGSVTVTNTGSGFLHIDRLEPSCGCASCELSSDTIASGERALLTIGARVKAQGEQVQFMVRIHSNDTSSPVTELIVTARGQPPIMLTEPKEIRFDEVFLGSTQAKTVHLFTGDGRPWGKEEFIVTSTWDLVLVERVGDADAGDLQAASISVTP